MLVNIIDRAKQVWNGAKKVVKVLVAPVMFVPVAVIGFVSDARAAIDLSDFSIDLASVETLVPIILIGGAAMWVIRKLVKTTNRS
mgnify:FL=1